MSGSKSKNLPGSTFPIANKPEKGYSRGQVDEFLEEVKSEYYSPGSTPNSVTSQMLRTKSFGLKKNGYDPRFVDAALDRLEDLFADRERKAFIQSKGVVAWQEQVINLLADLDNQMSREKGKRFKKLSLLSHGYRIAQVDAAIDQIHKVIHHNGMIKPNQIRQLRFHPQRGGYDEAQVDIFLDAVVEYLQATK